MPRKRHEIIVHFSVPNRDCRIFLHFRLDCPGLWLGIKRIHDQKFVKEIIFYREQLLFQISLIRPFWP